MTERGILFSGPMVRALLAGTKTQTRRVMKRQPPTDAYQLTTILIDPLSGDRRDEGKHQWMLLDGFDVVDGGQPMFSCPYGIPGDTLWVRESFYVQPDIWCSTHGPQPLHYAADVANPREVEDYVLRPSLFMPRWASRITLTLVDVRVQRVQEISDDDAAAEGAERGFMDGPDWEQSDDLRCGFLLGYQRLWDSINAKRGYGWDTNPWVFALTFRVKAP